MKDINEMTVNEKYRYLYDKVYPAIAHSHIGTLNISTHYKRKVCELLGGSYDDLNKLQKGLLKSMIVEERVYVEGGFDLYLNY